MSKDQVEQPTQAEQQYIIKLIDGYLSSPFGPLFELNDEITHAYTSNTIIEMLNAIIPQYNITVVTENCEDSDNDLIVMVTINDVELVFLITKSFIGLDDE